MKSSLALSALLMVAACGDDASQEDDSRQEEATPDASQPSADAGHDASDGSADASRSDASVVTRKPACSLLTAAEVAAVLGVAQNASELVGGMQCQFASADPDRKSVRALLEVVDNGRAIYDANLRMYAAAGMSAVPQPGIGDQAAFISESLIRSSLITTRDDVLLRLNLGWGDPGTDSASQLQGERTLILTALSRL